LDNIHVERANHLLGHSVLATYKQPSTLDSRRSVY